MIKLTECQVRYISTNMLRFIIRDDFVLSSSLDIIRELKKKNIICRSKNRKRFDGYYGYKFTDYFISILKLNAISIYGSNELMYLMYDPVFIKAYNIKRQCDIAANELDKEKIGDEKYQKLSQKFYVIKENSECVLKLIVPLLDRFKIEIPEKLKESNKRRKRKNETRQVNSRVGSRNSATK